MVGRTIVGRGQMTDEVGSFAGRTLPRLVRDERILGVLGDASARRILLMLDGAPRSARDLLEQNPMPQSTLYRKLHELRDLGLIGIQATLLTPDSKRVDLFRSTVEELQVTVRADHLDLRIRYRDLHAERLRTMWENLRAEARR